MMHLNLVFIFFVFTFSSLSGQEWKNGIDTACRNFFLLREQLHSSSEELKINSFSNSESVKMEKEQDGEVEKLKRWEWFWENRIDSIGNIPEPDFNSSELERYQKEQEYQKTAVVSANWKSLGPEGYGRVNCIEFHPTDTTIIWIGTPAGGLWKSTDGGDIWKVNEAFDKFTSIGVSDIAIDSKHPEIMYLATGDDDGSHFFNNVSYSTGILKSIDGGNSWNTTGLPSDLNLKQIFSKVVINPKNSNLVIAAGKGGIWRSENAGVSWTKTSSVYFRDLEFRPGDSLMVYAAQYGNSGGSSAIYKSIDAGKTWIRKALGFPSSDISRISIGVTAANANYIYALNSSIATSAFHSLCRSKDSGEHWETVYNSPFSTSYQAWLNQAIAVSPDSPDVICIGEFGVYKSTDGGFTFGFSSNPHPDIHSLAFSPHNGKVIFCGNDGGIARSDDEGTSFLNISGGLTITQLYKLSSSATNPGLIISGAQDNGTNTLINGVSTSVNGGDGMNCLVDYSTDSIMYASSQFGDLVRLNKNSWGYGLTFIKPTGITDHVWIVPYALHPTNPHTIYAAYDKVMKSSDRGNSWEPISEVLTAGGENLKIIAVAPSNGDVIYTATSRIFPTSGAAGKLFRTYNGGGEWKSILVNSILPLGSSNITSIAIHPTDPTMAWLSVSGYLSGKKVFKTTDGGNTWKNVSGSLPNVPANCLVCQHDNLHGLYLGTDLGVFYTNDLLTDWIPFNQGMPNALVTDMDIQYSTGKLRVATFGRGIWESDLCTVTNSIDEVDNRMEIKIYPNPFANAATLYIDYKLKNVIGKTGKTELKIYNTLGSIVKTISIFQTGNTLIERDALSNGIYFYQICDENKIFKTGKFVIE